MALSWKGSWCNSLASSNLALSALVESPSLADGSRFESGQG
jgi:hypothetical protein